ncbi:MAG TPA: hypothetical protein VG478_14270, partial [Acidimicrobiales bacterium]|jgi:hypothetical protein|nr:hypothetical protein [Acidimicrobiales bacterium]
MTRAQVRSRLRRGEWRWAAKGVVVVASSPDTWLRRAMVATLVQPGRLWVSHRAAAHAHGLDGFAQPPAIEVLGHGECRAAVPKGVTLHRSDVPGRADRTTVRGVPVINVAATLCLLPQVASTARVAQALDHVLRAGSSPRWLRQTAERFRRRGLHGPNVLLDLLAERVNRRLPRSWFERMAQAVLDRAGIPLEHEFPVTDLSGRIVASLDLAAPRWRVGVECQSWAEHGSPRQQYGDVRRRRALRELGWDIVELWWWDLARPEEVTREVLAALERQQRLTGQQPREVRVGIRPEPPGIRRQRL